MFEKMKELNKFHGDKMPLLAIEVTGEFIQAVSKYERKKDDDSREDMITKITDMVIIMTCICIREGISKEEIVERI